jgi:hypothetical protein
MIGSGNVRQLTALRRLDWPSGNARPWHDRGRGRGRGRGVFRVTCFATRRGQGFAEDDVSCWFRVNALKFDAILRSIKVNRSLHHVGHRE